MVQHLLLGPDTWSNFAPTTLCQAVELVEAPRTAFARMDLNGDGVVDADEFMAAVQAPPLTRLTRPGQ